MFHDLTTNNNKKLKKTQSVQMFSILQYTEPNKKQFKSNQDCNTSNF